MHTLTTLDLITIGRVSVDLYGQQIGTQLEDVDTFKRSVGGCPANIAIGAARLGLRCGFISRVGDEQMGRYVRTAMQREGVDTHGLITDSDRFTSLVLLAVENNTDFPLLFYRDNCADSALGPQDLDIQWLQSAGAVLVTGTHFAREQNAAAQMLAISTLRACGGKVIFDVDYRPNLWGQADKSAGALRYVQSDQVTSKLLEVLPHCDLIVGTDEEMQIAAGIADSLQALQRIRHHNPTAVLVLKRGALGCVVFDGAIDSLDSGIVGDGFPIEVYNVLGAGDSFMAGFLRGWLRGEPLQRCASWGNACGALAVSRLLCANAIPDWNELQHFVTKGSEYRALRKDPQLNHLHWVATRSADVPGMVVFAIDHRQQFEELADSLGVDRSKISRFKQLAVQAAVQVAGGRRGFGMLLDHTWGQQALFDAARGGFDWIGCPVELPGSCPLAFEYGDDIAAQLSEWPLHHCIKVLCLYHPDDPQELKDQQQQRLGMLYRAARRVGRELLIEIICSNKGPVDSNTCAACLRDLYQIGIKPDWWKLEPSTDRAHWDSVAAVIEAFDPHCRGIVMLGLEASHQQLAQACLAARDTPWVKGMAIGRTLFNGISSDWLVGRISEKQAVEQMAQRFDALAQLWAEVCSYRTS